VQDWESGHLPKIVKLLRSHGVFAEAQQAVYKYLQAARLKLEALPESESRSGLSFLTQYLAQQTDALERQA
jgi:geranylgeranyl pyrophosphate synthase